MFKNKEMPSDTIQELVGEPTDKYHTITLKRWTDVQPVCNYMDRIGYDVFSVISPATGLDAQFHLLFRKRGGLTFNDGSRPGGVMPV